VYTCRECEQEINQATEVCPYCGTDLYEPLPEDKPQKKTSIGKTLFRYFVLLGAIWGFLWFILPERTAQDATARAEQRAFEALREVSAALALYASAGDGSFPSSLDALPPDSSAKIKTVAEAALAEGYRLEYTALQLGDDNRSRHFVLLARPRNYGFRNFYVDQNGVIRSTRDDRPATAQDSPHSPGNP
jgi:hypothetical protein